MFNMNITGIYGLPIFMKKSIVKKWFAEEFGESTMTSETTDSGLIVPHVSIQQGLAREEVIMKCLMRV